MQFGDLKSDIQAKVDENIRLAGQALGMNNLRNAEQFAMAALNANGAMSSVDPGAFGANQTLISQILQKIKSPSGSGSESGSPKFSGMLTKKTVAAASIGLLAVVGIVYYLKTRA